MPAVIDLQDIAALALRASYNSAGLAQQKKALAIIENNLLALGKPELELIQVPYLPETSSKSLNTRQSLLHCTVAL